MKSRIGGHSTRLRTSGSYIPSRVHAPGMRLIPLAKWPMSEIPLIRGNQSTSFQPSHPEAQRRQPKMDQGVDRRCRSPDCHRLLEGTNEIRGSVLLFLRLTNSEGMPVHRGVFRRPLHPLPQGGRPDLVLRRGSRVEMGEMAFEVRPDSLDQRERGRCQNGRGVKIEEGRETTVPTCRPQLTASPHQARWRGVSGIKVRHR